jgi:hypothetical protein
VHVLRYAMPVLAGLALAGCGGSGGAPAGAAPTTATVAENGVARLAPADILARSKAALAKATSVHVVGRLTDGGQQLRFDLHIHGVDGGYGTLFVQGHRMEVVRVGQTAYVKADAGFWSRELGNPAVARRLAGKYLKGSANDPELNQLTAFTNVSTLSDLMLKPVSTLAAKDRKTVNGTLALGLYDNDSRSPGVLYVALQGEPYPVRLGTADAKAKDPASIDLTEYNRPITVTAPKPNQIIDMKSLGGG